MGLLFISLLLGEPASILRARAMQPGDYFEKISSPVSLRYTVARFRVSGYFLDVGDATGRLFHYKRRNWMFLLRTLGAFEIAVPRIYKFSSLVNFPRDKYFQPRSLYVAECWNADGDDRFSRCRHFSYVFGFTILLLLKVNRYRCRVSRFGSWISQTILWLSAESYRRISTVFRVSAETGVT